ncbi:hypothetical protein NMY22_g12560 [Coprinellus aureogranulatus]|nr:hypothetical protein NMY22_g12560 [Coprinellus aureogranulatus]
MNQPLPCTENLGVVQTNLRALSHVFTTNDPPLQIEVAMLQEGVTTLSTQISRLRSDLTRLEQELLLHHMGLSPMRRVPPEIFSEIFGHAGWTAVKNIALVCRAWHAASSPIISKHHSNLSITFAGQTGVSRSCQKIRSSFQKAGNNRKSLRLAHTPPETCQCFRSSICPWANTDLPKALEGLSLGCLALDLSTPNCFLSFVCSLRQYESSSGTVITAWQSLRSLELDFPRQSPVVAPLAHKGIFANLPNKLESFTLKLGYIDSTREPPEVIVPSGKFVHLTSLKLACDWNSSSTISFLRHCPNLESLELNAHAEEDTAAAAATVAELSLSALSTLKLVIVGGGRWKTFKSLELLHLPAIANLTIDCARTYDHDASWRALKSLRLLSPSQVSDLRCLVIKNTSLQAGGLIEGLLDLPSLERLVLDCVELDTKRLRNLERARVAGLGKTPILLVPHITSLELRSIQAGFQLPFFPDFIQEREVLHKERRRRKASASGTVHSNRLQQIRFRFVSWDVESQETWHKCSNAVQVLQREFGVIVDRMIRGEQEEDIEKGDFRELR